MRSIFFLALPVAIFLLLGTLRTARTKSSKYQQDFLKGKIPSSPLNGFYQGQVHTQTTWLGKVFDAKNQIGINRFKKGEDTQELYQFKTYLGKGLTDNISVVKLDYNLPTNPVYLRFVIDELVEVAPEKYIGKLNVKFGPLAFALGFFQLEK